MTMRGITIATNAKLSARQPAQDATAGSFVIVHNRSGKPIVETYSPRVVSGVNKREYTVYTALEWLRNIGTVAKN